MIRRTNLFALPAFLLMGLSCSGGPRHAMVPGILQQLESRAGDATGVVPRRSLAETEAAPRCYLDRLGSSELKKTVTEASSRYRSAGGASGGADSWRDIISLADQTPAARAFFRGAGGKWIVEGPSYAGCKDPVCVINRAYGKPDDSEEGFLAYLYFLRTGVILSVDSKVESDTSNSFYRFDARENLFSLAELQALNLLAQGISGPLSSIPVFDRIHRFGRNSYPPDWLEDEDKAKGLVRGTVCGKADSRGFVRVTDSCLWLPTPVDQFFRNGGIFLSVTHEIGHEFDRPELRPDRMAWKRIHSETSEWLSISGWVNESRTLADGSVKTGWFFDDAKEGFPRPYAKTAPVEDFAESLAFYRFSPDTMAALPKKSEYLKRHAYAGRVFTAEGFSAFARQKAKSAILESVPAFGAACVGQPLVALAALGIVPDEQGAIPIANPSLRLDLPLDEMVKSCLDHSALSVASRELDRVRLDEPEGCVRLDEAVSKAIATEAVADSADDIGVYFERQAEVQKLVAEVSRFRAQLSEAIDPREAYPKCREAQSPRDCFVTAMDEALKSVADTGGYREALGGEVLEAEFKRFHDIWPFEKVEAVFASVWAQIFEGVKARQLLAAKKRWESCSSAVYPQPAPGIEGPSELLLSPYNGGTNYVDARMLACLNGDADSTMSAVLQRYFKEVLGIEGMVNESTFRFLRQRHLDPAWNELSEEKVTEARRVEDEVRARIALKAVPALRAGLLADLTWLDGVTGTAQVTERCEDRALSRLRAGTVPERGEIPVVYRAFETTERDWVASSCRDIARVPTVSARLQAVIAEEARQAELRWKSALAKMEELTLAEAGVRADACVRQHPGRASTYRRARRDCLTIPWDSFVRDALEKWKTQGFEAAILAREAEARKWAGATRRSALQTQALTEMEARLN